MLDALDMIQRNIKVEARLIENLLDLTRISGTKSNSSSSSWMSTWRLSER